MKIKNYIIPVAAELECRHAWLHCMMAIDFDLMPADPSVGIMADDIEINRVWFEFDGSAAEASGFDAAEVKAACREWIEGQQPDGDE